MEKDDIDGSPPRPVMAAQYLRMSTTMQRYSLENQRAAIQRFADSNGIRIVREYADRGKSGLSIQGREGLASLLSDIRAGQSEFSALLVYDVSRWGRFQDPDEGAFYEFLCRRAGITVHYCAERFNNDNTPMNTVLKSLRRAMAAEYSRELSERCFRGSVNVAKKGFNTGGPPSYGLQRLLIDSERKPKCLLALGEQKAISTDHVILVPGPKEETDVVKEIFRLYADEKQRSHEIAASLNEQGIPTNKGKRWARSTVLNVLKNERLIGVNTYNRHSFKLKTKKVHNPPSEWVRSMLAFEPIVSPEIFMRARAIRRERNRGIVDEALLTNLRQTWKRNGRLSAGVVASDPKATNVKTLQNHFGSFSKACELIGYKPESDAELCQSRFNRFQMRQIEYARLREVGREHGHTWVLNRTGRIAQFTEGPLIRVLVVRAVPTSGRRTVWFWKRNQLRQEQLVLLVRLNRENDEVHDRHLVPRHCFDLRNSTTLTDAKKIRGWEKFKIDHLDEVFERFNVEALIDVPPDKISRD